jgi:DNA-binding NtrC family response regulator
MKKAVLFVDDHQALCRLSCDILRHAGYHAVPAYSAAEALQVFDSMRFDIVVTDIRMEGMDGVALARALRHRAPKLPIIMVSGYGPVEAGEETVYIAKGELFPALLKQMRVCLSVAENGSPSPAS